MMYIEFFRKICRVRLAGRYRIVVKDRRREYSLNIFLKEKAHADENEGPDTYPPFFDGVVNII